MGNVLDVNKQLQVLALGRLSWTLRWTEQETSVRRETASAYLWAAAMAIRGRGRPGESKPKPATSEEVSTDSRSAPPWPRPGRAPCDSGVSRIAISSSRPSAVAVNAMAIWQDLVYDWGFAARDAVSGDSGASFAPDRPSRASRHHQ